MVRIKLHLSVAFFLAATAFPPVQIQVVARPAQEHSNPPSGHRNPPSGLSVHRPNTLAELPSWNPPQLTRPEFKEKSVPKPKGETRVGALPIPNRPGSHSGSHQPSPPPHSQAPRSLDHSGPSAPPIPNRPGSHPGSHQPPPPPHSPSSHGSSTIQEVVHSVSNSFGSATDVHSLSTASSATLASAHSIVWGGSSSAHPSGSPSSEHSSGSSASAYSQDSQPRSSSSYGSEFVGSDTRLLDTRPGSPSSPPRYPQRRQTWPGR